MIPNSSILKIWIITLFLITGLAVSGAAAPAIDITPHQKEQLKALATDTRSKMEHERDNLRHARMELTQVYSNYNIDEHKVKALQERISTSQLNLLNAHLDNEIAIRSILSQDQFDTLRHMINPRGRNRRMLVQPPVEEAAFDHFPNKEIFDSIGLTPDQEKRIAKVLKINQNRAKVIEKLRRNSKQMLDLYSNYNLDTAAAKKLIDSIHQDQIAMLNAQRNRQVALRSVLSQDQFQKLHQEIAKWIAEHRHPQQDGDEH